MPRFGTKSLLIGVAVIALWLSSVTAGPATSDLRQSILLVPFVVSAVGALFCKGSHRAFWMGFFISMLMLGTDRLRGTFPQYVPDIDSASWIADRLSGGDQGNVTSLLYWTIWACWVLALATIMDAWHRCLILGVAVRFLGRRNLISLGWDIIRTPRTPAIASG